MGRVRPGEQIDPRNGEAVELSDGYTFTAQPDSVYQVTARWEGEDTGGVLTWGFQTVD